MNGHEVEPIYHVSSIILIFQWFVDQVENHNYNNTNYGQHYVEKIKPLVTLTFEYAEQKEWNQKYVNILDEVER